MVCFLFWQLSGYLGQTLFYPLFKTLMNGLLFLGSILATTQNKVSSPSGAGQDLTSKPSRIGS
jgi:hypothetical protein